MSSLLLRAFRKDFVLPEGQILTSAEVQRRSFYAKLTADSDSAVSKTPHVFQLEGLRLMGDGIDPVPWLNVFLGTEGRADAVGSGRDRADHGISPSAQLSYVRIPVLKVMYGTLVYYKMRTRCPSSYLSANVAQLFLRECNIVLSIDHALPSSIIINYQHAQMLR